MVRSRLTLLLVKVFSAGLVLRWRGEWPNCGHSLGVLAAGRTLAARGVPAARWVLAVDCALAAAPAGAATAARPNGAASAAIPARVINLDVARMITPPAKT